MRIYDCLPKARYLALLGLLIVTGADAQMRPPPFIGGVPGRSQFQAIEVQRHQSRTLLYREALEELRRNPAAADVAQCSAAKPEASGCIPAAAKPAAASDAVVPTRRRIALLIGNNSYRQPIPPLETPIHDVEKIGEILKSRFGYEVKTLRNAGKQDILRAVASIAASAAPEDSVLVMYAGHGYLMDDTRMGFWIPVDAAVTTAANWISNTDIAKFLAAIPARQVALISDSCFSGSLVREEKISTASQRKKSELFRQRSVLAFSSGGDEPVSDEGKNGHSIFAWSLISALDQLEQTAPGFQIYENVKDKVTREYPQEPQYGGVSAAGHQAGGDFLLEREGG